MRLFTSAISLFANTVWLVFYCLSTGCAGSEEEPSSAAQTKTDTGANKYSNSEPARQSGPSMAPTLTPPASNANSAFATLTPNPCSWAVDYRILIPVATGSVILSILGSVFIIRCADCRKRHREQRERQKSLNRMQRETELETWRVTEQGREQERYNLSGPKRRSKKRRAHHSVRTPQRDQGDIFKEQEEEETAFTETSLLDDFESNSYDDTAACPYSYVTNQDRFCEEFTVHNEKTGGENGNPNKADQCITLDEISHVYLTFRTVKRKSLMPGTEKENTSLSVMERPRETSRVSFNLMPMANAREGTCPLQSTNGLTALLKPDCHCSRKLTASMVSSQSSKRTGEIEEFILVQQESSGQHPKKTQEKPAIAPKPRQNGTTVVPAIRGQFDDGERDDEIYQNIYSPTVRAATLPPRPAPRRSLGKKRLTAPRNKRRKSRDLLSNAVHPDPPSMNKEGYQLLRDPPPKRPQYRSYAALTLNEETVPKTVEETEVYQKRNIYVKNTRGERK